MKTATFPSSPGNAHGCHFLPGNQADFRIYNGCRGTLFVSALTCSCSLEPVSSFPGWDPTNKAWMECESSTGHAGVWDHSHLGLCMQGC